MLKKRRLELILHKLAPRLLIIVIGHIVSISILDNEL